MLGPKMGTTFNISCSAWRIRKAGNNSWASGPVGSVFISWKVQDLANIVKCRSQIWNPPPAWDAISWYGVPLAAVAGVSSHLHLWWQASGWWLHLSLCDHKGPHLTWSTYLTWHHSKVAQWIHSRSGNQTWSQTAHNTVRACPIQCLSTHDWLKACFPSELTLSSELK